MLSSRAEGNNSFPHNRRGPEDNKWLIAWWSCKDTATARHLTCAQSVSGCTQNHLIHEKLCQYDYLGFLHTSNKLQFLDPFHRLFLKITKL